MFYKVKEKNKNIVLAEKAKIASSLLDKTIGLMFKESLEGFDGLIITKCNSIHSFFMKIPIHAIFLDKQDKVIKIINDLRPWRITGIYFKANKVLELDASKKIEGLKEGDQVEIICLS